MSALTDTEIATLGAAATILDQHGDRYTAGLIRTTITQDERDRTLCSARNPLHGTPCDLERDHHGQHRSPGIGSWWHLGEGPQE